MRNRLSALFMRACLLAGAVATLAAVGQSANAACDATCQTALVNGHNAARQRVNNGTEPAPGGTFQPKANPPLANVAWDANIQTPAQAYADNCTFAHSAANQRPGRGENLYASTGAQQASTPADSVTSWDGESTLYTYGALPGPNFSQIGHYTQVVWADTTTIGCGITTCNTNSPFPPNFGTTWTLVVCQYAPAGNFTGQFPYQTLPIQQGVQKGPLDVDGSGTYDALTDGVIVLRYLFGLTGPQMVSNALANNASITDPATILTNLTTLRPQLDIDGNQQVDALTDGLLIIRYMFGLRGTTLVSGAVANNATRTTSGQIEPVIAALMP